MIKGIFFDAHGVLYERHETATPYARRLLAARGYPTQVSAEDKQHLAVLREQASIGGVTPETYWDEFLKAHGVESAAERTEIAALILERPHEVFELPGASSTLRELKRRGFVLGVITDTMYPLDWKMSWLAKIGVADYLDNVSCSTVVGSHKPDPAIYMDALNRASLNPGQAVFVGHEARELEGARAVGLVTVAVHCGPDVKADYYLDTLPELLSLSIAQ